MLADVHVHLDREPAAALDRAEKAGVGIVLAAAVDIETSRANTALAAVCNQVKACVGIHPWRADQLTAEAARDLAGLVHAGQVTAVSETGIDLVRRLADDFTTQLPPLPLALQVAAFRAQLRLAAENGLFLVLHDRGATGDILAILDEFAGQNLRGIVHGFTGTVEDARRYRERGFLISVNPRCLQALDPVLPFMDVHELVLETDSAEPAGVREVCREVAGRKRLSVEEVEAATTANVVKLLGR